MEEEDEHRTRENRREAKNSNTFFIVSIRSFTAIRSIRTISIISIAVEKSAWKKIEGKSNEHHTVATCCKPVRLALLILPPFSTVQVEVSLVWVKFGTCVLGVAIVSKNN